MNNEYRFIMTKDEDVAKTLIDEGVILVSELYDCWVFVNDNKERDIKNISYTNRISV